MPVTCPIVLIGIGANLPSERFGLPINACRAAVAALDETGDVRVVARSRWFESEPVPKSDQPWFVNGVVEVDTDLAPARLLECLHAIEARFGRVRTVQNAARVLDLDLLAYGDDVVAGGNGGLRVPHPRLAERAFVLLPLQDIRPAWTHPETGRTVAEMLDALPPGQVCRPLKEAQNSPGFAGAKKSG